MTYKWQQLSKSQQDYARRIAEKIKYQVSTSQVAKYLDDFAAYDRGEITAADLTARTGHKVAQ
jgi:hypothetical protein